MSTTSQDDWRAEALRNMEAAEQEPIEERQRQDNWVAVVTIKFVAWFLFTVALVWIAGWGSLAAAALAAWFLFWPR